MHLLHPAHQPRANYCREGKPPDSGGRNSDRLPAGVSRERNHLWRPERTEQPGGEIEESSLELSDARRTQYPAAHDLPRQVEKPERRNRTETGDIISMETIQGSEPRMPAPDKIYPVTVLG